MPPAPAPAPYVVLASSPLDLVPARPEEESFNGQWSSSSSSSSASSSFVATRAGEEGGFKRVRRRVLAPAAIEDGFWNGSTAAGSGTEAGGGSSRGMAGLAKRSLEPNDTQKVTLGVIGAYAVVITILWNVPYVHWVLYPWKMLVIAFHEFSHAAAGCCTGAKVKSITLDPREGGCTMMAGGVGAVTLPAGYLGSSLVGALLVFCGFDVVASKVASIVVGVCFLLTLWWGKKDWLTIVTILLATGFIVACWFIAHGAALRFYLLFLGVMNSLYSLYDICDDLIFRKVNESDASVFAKRYGGSSVCWGVVWLIISLALLACAIVAGLAAFKDTFSEQAQAGKDFLPTRFMLF
ncbi:hypothetical protein JCM11251_007523 [Rhodosporidiobolus azoricus]